MQLNYNHEFPDEFVQHPNQHDKGIKCKNKVNGTTVERQQPGPFMQWIQTILGIKPTTTTVKPPSQPLEDCPPCTKCGVPSNGTKIVGNENLNKFYFFIFSGNFR